MTTRPIVLALDFNNFVFQSYYGEKLFNNKGENINAVKSFFLKLKVLKESLNPDMIVICNDLSRSKTFRRKLFKDYKANRKTRDDDILLQMSYISKICGLLGYPIINHEEYEADDILGMISRLCMDNDMDCIIVTSDRDLYQLVNTNVYIYSPRKKEYIDDIWLMENYGVTPEQWIELKILQGDRSDNIPGIPGIGEVTALRLIREYNTIENVYNHLGYLKPKIKEMLIKDKDVLPLSRSLVTIITDYNKIGLTVDDLKRKEVFKEEAIVFVNEINIYSLVDVFRYSLFYDKF